MISPFSAHVSKLSAHYRKTGTGHQSRVTGTGTKQRLKDVGGDGGPPVVYDDNGTDVTPKALHSLKPTVLGSKKCSKKSY